MDVSPDALYSSGSGPPPSQKKERGAIAAQACDTCRSRKQKCDERRPKCGLCQRMRLECRYREPQPTKKDKTLVEILDRLKVLETKVDRIPTRPFPPGFVSQSSPSSHPSFSAEDPSAYTPSSHRTTQKTSPDASSSSRNQPYRHASASHKLLSWPAVQQLLLSSRPANLHDVQSLESEGSAFILQLQRGSQRLPLDDELGQRPFLGMQMQATRTTGGHRVTFPELTYETMLGLAESYFDTFNLLYPFMDRQNFLLETLVKVHSEGFDGDTDSVIALLVFALGNMAIDQGCACQSHAHHAGKGGFRDSIERPPGLAYFNEARKRIGFVMTECDLDNVQVFCLAALYYQACSRHVDFWRMTVSASMACQVLVTCSPIDWRSPKGDLTKRIFWHCAIMETGLHLELDLPLTGLISLEDRVGLPTFSVPLCEADARGNQYSHFEAHFASQIALRRLCANLHSNINDSMSSVNTPATSNEDFGGPSASTLTQLASQLDQWRSLLPHDLRWPEDDPTASPLQSQDQEMYSESLDPTLAQPYSRPPSGPFFTTNDDGAYVHYPYVYDIQVALLRTRYSYAKYTVHRPFVYKALHFPEQMTREDAEGVATCLKSCLKWPITLAPVSCRKRLVPYLFCWSSNFLGILIILHLTRHIPILRQIRSQLCGPTFEADAEESVNLMLSWIRESKSSDSIAQWSWRLLEDIYDMDS